MNILDLLYEKALRNYTREQRRALKRREAGGRGSGRRCGVCHEVTPTYRLIKPEGRPQMCVTCREAELRGEIH